MRAKQFITELFNAPYKFEWKEPTERGDYDAVVTAPGVNMSINFNKATTSNDYFEDKVYSVEFRRNNSVELTGDGDSERIMATALYAIRQFLEKVDPYQVYFTASYKVEDEDGNDEVNPSRAKLYSRMVKRYVAGTQYYAREYDIEKNNEIQFVLTYNGQIIAGQKGPRHVDESVG